MLDFALSARRRFWRLCCLCRFFPIAFVGGLAFLLVSRADMLQAQGSDAASADEYFAVDSVFRLKHFDGVVRVLSVQRPVTLCEKNYLIRYMSKLEFIPDLIWVNCEELDESQMIRSFWEDFNIYCAPDKIEISSKDYAFQLLELRKDPCMGDKLSQKICVSEYRKELPERVDSALFIDILEQFKGIEQLNMMDQVDLDRLDRVDNIMPASIRWGMDSSLIFLTLDPIGICKTEGLEDLQDALCFTWSENWLDWAKWEDRGSLSDFNELQLTAVSEQLSFNLGSPAAISLLLDVAETSSSIVVTFLRRYPFLSDSGAWSLPLQAFVYLFDDSLNLINRRKYFDPLRLPNTQISAIWEDNFYLAFYDRELKKSGFISWSLFADSFIAKTDPPVWNFRDRFGLLQEMDGKLAIGYWDEGSFTVEEEVLEGYIAWQGLNEVVLRQESDAQLRPGYMLLGADCVESSCLFLEYLQGSYYISISRAATKPEALIRIEDDERCSLIQYDKGALSRLCKRDSGLTYERMDRNKLRAMLEDYSEP